MSGPWGSPKLPHLNDAPHSFEEHGLEFEECCFSLTVKGTSLKGTGFSPYIIPSEINAALAAEGRTSPASSQLQSFS